MALYEVSGSKLVKQAPAQFAGLKLYERADLQRLLRDDISVLDDDLLVLSEEFGHWQDARRRIDLLAIDRGARLVVIELKRTDDGGHMELQSIRYAAMVSTMSFKDVLAAFEAHRTKQPGTDPDVEPADELRAFLDATDLDDDPEISSDVRIILVSADFGVEITTSVIWLNKFEGMDIRCVRLRPYDLDGKVFLDIQQVLPLPEAADYQVKVRRKEAAQERARTDGKDYTRYSIVVDGSVGPDLNKRSTIMEMVKALAAKGIAPSRIKAAMPPSRMRSVDAELSDLDAIAAAFKSVVPNFDARRWNLDEALHEDGKTYIVSTQWGLRNTEPVLNRLVEAFPKSGVTFQRHAPKP